MSEKEAKQPARGGRRPQRPRNQRGPSNRDDSKKQNEERGDKEERKNTFVPWFGEARPKRGPIYDLEAKLGTKIMLEFLSGRIIEGILASYDRYMNLVLEDTVELLDDGKTRQLGKVFTCGRVEAMGPATS